MASLQYDSISAMMISMRALAILFFVSGLCEASNILVISTVASHSHSLWCNKLAELLVNRGHRVTILDTDPPKKNLVNLTTYQLEGAYAFAPSDYQEISSKEAPNRVTDFIYEYRRNYCKNTLFSPTFQNFLDEHCPKRRPFDLVIHDITSCECFLGLVPLLGYPKLIGVSAFSEESALFLMGNQPNMIHNPLHISPFSHPMGCLEKLENLLYSLYHYYIYYRYVSDMDGYSKEVFGNSTPHVVEVARSAALALVNAHPILDGAKYYSPAILQIPGFHIDEPKSLDSETQSFLDGADNGAIYFSLGTNFQSAQIPKEKIQMFLNVFKSLKQRVLWKFEGPSDAKWPDNVMVSKWFRQNDVLAHPNTIIFISHCGLLGTQEAIHHGVPMIAMPLWLDQHFITKRLTKQGVAVPLPYKELSEENLKVAIDRLLTNESYRIKMKRLSEIFKDRETKPRDLAVYWIEYVLRHEDLTFLKPPEAFLNTLELYLLDVKTFFGIALGLILAALVSSTSSKPHANKRKYKRT